MREQLIASVTVWRAAMLRAISQAKEEGHLRADTDPDLMLFELYSFTLGLHHDARFLHSPDAVRLRGPRWKRRLFRIRARAVSGA